MGDGLMKMKQVRLATLGLALAITQLAGCKAPMSPDAAMANGLSLSAAKASTLAPTKLFKSSPKIVRTSSMDANDGMAHLNVNINVLQKAEDKVGAPHFSLKDISMAWDTAFFTLYSSTASTGFNKPTHTFSLDSLLDFDGGSPVDTSTTPITLPPLRPATDYTARCFLQDGGKVAASNEQTGVTLDAGAQILTFTLDPNSNETHAQLTNGSSTNFNRVHDVTGDHVVKGDTIDFASGMDASQEGVNHVDVIISGPGYSNSTAKIATLTPPNLNAFTWNTGVATGTYAPASLSGGAGQLTNNATLTFKAYHADDAVNEVGSEAITVKVHGKPSITVKLQ